MIRGEETEKKNNMYSVTSSSSCSAATSVVNSAAPSTASSPATARERIDNIQETESKEKNEKTIEKKRTGA